MTSGRVVAFFVLVTVLLTWPQALQLSRAPDHRDAYFSMWRLGWIAHQLPRDPAHLFDANIYYPERHTLAFSDAIVLEGLTGAPLVWAGVPLPVAYNVLVLAGFVACGLGMYLLVRALTGCAAAGLISGLVFAFAPYRFDHYMHLELLWAQWMPLTLWMIHRALDRNQPGAGLWAGTLLALQGLSSIYYAVFFATFMAVVLPILIVGRTGRRAALGLAAGGMLAVLCLGAYVMPYRAAQTAVGERRADEAQLYSAGPKHYLAAMPENWIYGSVTGSLGRAEKRLFPGAVAIILTIVGLWPPLDRKRLAYAAGLAVAIDGSFGLNGVGFGWLREHVFLFRGLRVPARFGQVTLLAMAVLAGFGGSRMFAWLREYRPRWRGPAAAVIVALVVLECANVPLRLVPVETRAGEVYEWLRTQPQGVVAEYPMPTRRNLPLHDPEFAYASTFHWRPLVNGYSGNYPALYMALLDAVSGFPLDPAIPALRSAGVEYVLIHERYLPHAQYSTAVQALDLRDDVRKAGPFRDGAFEVMAYRIVRGTP